MLKLLAGLLLPLLGWSATGEVLLRGTAIESGHFTGFPSSNAFDGDLTTFWANSGVGGWVGLDLGSGNTAILTRFRVTPRISDVNADYSVNLAGAQIQGSNDCTFATGTSTLATLAAGFWLHDLQLIENTATGSAAFRCFRAIGSGGLVSGTFQSGEIQFIGTIAGGTPAASPDRPTVSQWGGIFLSGPTVTLSSRTTSAALYYTLDGTTPTTSSTLYSAPFVVTPGSGGTTLNVLANDATLSTPASLITPSSFYAGFVQQSNLYDDRGLLLQAFDGGVVWDSSTGRYYWFGVPVNARFWTGTEPGVNMYSSASLYGPWRFDGMVVPTPNAWPTRPHVIWNALTSKWVLWAHNDATDRAVIATASVITGPWTLITTSLNPDGIGYKDCNLFVDSNGTTAYTVYTNGSQSATIISLLAADYLSSAGSIVTLSGNANHEGPVLFKRGSTYFLITSEGHSYTEAFLQYYQTATNPLGTWSSLVTMGTYQSQSTDVFVVPGKVDAYMYLADHWTSNLNTFFAGTRPTWLPLTFPTSTTLSLTELSTWDLTRWASSAGHDLFPMPMPLKR